MERRSAVAWERAMKVQEVILRAMAKRLRWWQAAEILGITDRSMRRWKRRYDEESYDGWWDRRRGKPSPNRVLAGRVEVRSVLRSYFSGIRHFRVFNLRWPDFAPLPGRSGFE